MFVDSHCHIDFPELAERLPQLLENMRTNQVSHALCISVTLEDFPRVLALAEQHPNLYASVGVHPDYEEGAEEPTLERLVTLSAHPRVVGTGETGLDYYRLNGRSIADMEWQRERFRTHIRAARQTGKPLIIHTRSSADDTLRLMREENARLAASCTASRRPGTSPGRRWTKASIFRSRVSSRSRARPTCKKPRRRSRSTAC
jgi:TatD DNase family protein